jgi:hypothetical protein
MGATIMVEYERDPVPERRTDGGSGGIIAVLVVIVVLLVAGFLYFTRYGDVDDRPDIELNIPAPDVNTPDLDAPDVTPDVDPPGN